MPNAKTASLSTLLVAKKGSAAPAASAHPGLEAAHTIAAVEDSSATAYYKALTFKVDRERFTKLKSLGVQRDLRSQTLMTEALDLLFAKHNL